MIYYRYDLVMSYLTARPGVQVTALSKGLIKIIKNKEKTIKSPINIDFAEMQHQSTLRPRDSVTA